MPLACFILFELFNQGDLHDHIEKTRRKKACSRWQMAAGKHHGFRRQMATRENWRITKKGGSQTGTKKDGNQTGSKKVAAKP